MCTTFETGSIEIQCSYSHNVRMHASYQTSLQKCKCEMFFLPSIRGDVIQDYIANMITFSHRLQPLVPRLRAVTNVCTTNEVRSYRVVWMSKFATTDHGRGAGRENRELTDCVASARDVLTFSSVWQQTRPKHWRLAGLVVIDSDGVCSPGLAGYGMIWFHLGPEAVLGENFELTDRLARACGVLNRTHTHNVWIT